MKNTNNVNTQLKNTISYINQSMKCLNIDQNKLINVNQDSNNIKYVRVDIKHIRCNSNPNKSTNQSTNQSTISSNINQNKSINIKHIRRTRKKKVSHTLCYSCDDGYISTYEDCKCTQEICNYCNNVATIQCTTYGCNDGYQACMYCSGTGYTNGSTILNVLSGQNNTNTIKCIKCKYTGYVFCAKCNGDNIDNCIDCKGTGFALCTGCNGNSRIKCMFCHIILSCLICNNTTRVKTDIIKKCPLCVILL